MAFLATFKDGYTRTIAHPTIKTKTQALNYAKDLEVCSLMDTIPSGFF